MSAIENDIKLKTLEKELKATKDKLKKSKITSIISIIVLLLLSFWVYNYFVLSYAELDDISITRDGDSNNLTFSFKVKTDGKVVFYNGITELTDYKKSGEDISFEWSWRQLDNTEVGVKYRWLIFPKTYEKVF